MPAAQKRNRPFWATRKRRRITSGFTPYWPITRPCRFGPLKSKKRPRSGWEFPMIFSPASEPVRFRRVLREGKTFVRYQWAETRGYSAAGFHFTRLRSDRRRRGRGHETEITNGTPVRESTCAPENRAR